MARYQVDFVRLSDPSTQLDALREEYGGSAFEPSSGFAALLVERSFDLEALGVAKLSERFGEALRLAIDSGTWAILYEHWQSGSLRRALLYGREIGGWARVEGEPEAWERAYFFTEARHAAMLRDVEADIEAGAERDAAILGLSRLFEGGAVREGPHPIPSPEEMAKAIRASFGLPEP